MGPRKRIVLIAKENAQALLALLNGLAEKPEIQEAPDVLSLLTEFSTLPCDVLFLDADLLEESELGLIARFLKDRNQCRLLVAFSSKGAEIARKLRNLGAWPLWKPYLLAELHENLSSLLSSTKTFEKVSAEVLYANLSRGLSDELNNSLAAVSGYLQLLELDLQKKDDEEMGEKLSAVREGVERIADTVDRLRFVSGQKKLRKLPLDFAELFQQILKKMNPQTERPRFQIETEIANWSMVGDSEQLSLALESVLSFAVSLLNKKELVHIYKENQSPAKKSALTIHFHCPQFKAEWLAQLFEPYALDTHQIPVGLNLAFARGIVRAHGGEIFASIPSAGYLQIHLSLSNS